MEQVAVPRVVHRPQQPHHLAASRPCRISGTRTTAAARRRRRGRRAARGRGGRVGAEAEAEARPGPADEEQRRGRRQRAAAAARRGGERAGGRIATQRALGARARRAVRVTARASGER